MLYVDIPTKADLADLAAHRGDICVSIYLPTTPLSQQAQADRTALANQAREAIGQLEAAGHDKRRVGELAENLADLGADDGFWRFQARSLAIFATPENLRSFRIANGLTPMVMVADRFHLKPLLRALTFDHSCYVLALSENGVRLVEVSGDLPAIPVKVEGLPADAASAVGKASLNDRSPSGRITGSEGKKVRLRQFARQVDGALRERLAGRQIPLVLATVHSLGSLYRSINTYPGLVATTIEGNPDRVSDADLAAAARPIIDGLHRTRLAAWHDRFSQRGDQGRTTTDLGQAARAATFGAVESLLVDIDQLVHGTVDETDGAVTFADGPGAGSYAIADEIARRVLLAGGEVLAVRKADIPGGAPLAATLRYAL